MNTAESLFKKIKTPIFKRNKGGDEYHFFVSRETKNNKFIANFLNGTDDFYYKRNFKDIGLYGVLEKVYNRKIR